MSIIWTIIIGFVAGLIAKWIMPGRNEPSGFIMTTILGIVGAFVATYLGQALGWYRADEGAGFIGAIVGAVTAGHVADAIAEQLGVKVEKKKVTLNMEIKAFGGYTAEIKLYPGISEKITVSVVEA